MIVRLPVAAARATGYATLPTAGSPRVRLAQASRGTLPMRLPMGSVHYLKVLVRHCQPLSAGPARLAPQQSLDTSSQVSVWDPTGRPRTAAASANAPCKVAGLSRYPDRSTDWLTDWYPHRASGLLRPVPAASSTVLHGRARSWWSPGGCARGVASDSGTSAPAGHLRRGMRGCPAPRGRRVHARHTAGTSADHARSAAGTPQIPRVAASFTAPASRVMSRQLDGGPGVRSVEPLLGPAGAYCLVQVNGTNRRACERGGRHGDDWSRAVAAATR
jgi:hypothetical protein